MPITLYQTPEEISEDLKMILKYLLLIKIGNFLLSTTMNFFFFAEGKLLWY